MSEAEPPGEKAEPLQAEQEDHVCVGLHHAHARCSAVGLLSEEVGGIKIYFVSLFQFFIRLSAVFRSFFSQALRQTAVKLIGLKAK